MYNYQEFDRTFVRERVEQYRDQVRRRLDGALTEDEFKPLRLMNGVYLQLHAYMLRIAIPYGTLSSRQMRQLAYIADKWDKGYGHFTTRQNIQFNWPRLVDTPDILSALADVDMHAIQTSGNTIRNVTTDQFAGAALDEVADPRPYAELIRQWSTDHPEFQFLPRKFKIAITGAVEDRAVIRAHDIGLQLVEHEGRIAFKVFVGGGLGRTPSSAKNLWTACPQKIFCRTWRRCSPSITSREGAITNTRHESKSPSVPWVSMRFGRRWTRRSSVCEQHLMGKILLC